MKRKRALRGRGHRPQVGPPRDSRISPGFHFCGSDIGRTPSLRRKSDSEPTWSPSQSSAIIAPSSNLSKAVDSCARPGSGGSATDGLHIRDFTTQRIYEHTLIALLRQPLTSSPTYLDRLDKPPLSVNGCGTVTAVAPCPLASVSRALVHRCVHIRTSTVTNDLCLVQGLEFFARSVRSKPNPLVRFLLHLSLAGLASGHGNLTFQGCSYGDRPTSDVDFTLTHGANRSGLQSL